MAVIGWFALQQNDRFKSIEERLGKIETKIDSVSKAVGDLVTEVRLMNQRVVTLENRISATNCGRLKPHERRAYLSSLIKTNLMLSSAIVTDSSPIGILPPFQLNSEIHRTADKLGKNAYAAPRV